MTFPTGQVSSFRSDTDSSVHVQVETSSKDDVTITTNLSASGAFYTLLQGKPGMSWSLWDTGVRRSLCQKNEARQAASGAAQEQERITIGFSPYCHLICKTHKLESCKFSLRSFRIIFHCPIPLSEQGGENPLAANPGDLAILPS